MNPVEVFILGEKRYISYEVFTRSGDKNFTIRNCRYQLIKNGEIESSGEGEIDGHTIHVLVEPLTAYKSYNLVITYEIADQVLKEMLQIEVINP